MKRLLYLVHRWLGIALCLVMLPWFLSGIVMLYVGYPKLTDAERWHGLPPLEPHGCCVPIEQAWAAAGLGAAASSPRATWRLTSVAGAPTYVFGAGPARLAAVDARSGRRIESADMVAAMHAAALFAPGQTAQPIGTVDEDAWTHSRALDAHRPLHRVEVDGGRWLYVSSRTGEVIRDATRTERGWGWLGAWLHWLYLFRGGPLDAWWTDIIITLSLAASLMALAGLVVGVLRWRFRTPYRNGSRTPYTGAMPRWHHLLGLVGGVLALTWAVSGLLSVNPWKVFTAGGPKPDRLAYAGGPLEPGRAPSAAMALATLAANGMNARELEWVRVGDEHLVLAHGGGQSRVIDAHGLRPQGLAEATWRTAAPRMLPGAAIVAEQRVERYDAYYFAREPHTMTGHRERPLPVWRLRFNDPNQTWVTIDPHTGTIVQVLDGHQRADRWLFGFLHSFDLPALLQTRPLWDVGMIGFSLVGLGLSATGVVTGWRRLKRKVAVPARRGRMAAQAP